MEQTSLKNQREAEAPIPSRTPRTPPQCPRPSSCEHRCESAQASAGSGPAPHPLKKQPLGLPFPSL